MHLYPAHTELDIEKLHAFLRANPLGHFITNIKHPKFDDLQCSHIPFVIDPPKEGSKGALRGHITRVNPQCKAMLETIVDASASTEGPIPELAEDVLVMFNSSVNSYVTPSMYVDTKPTTSKVVPTWNYQSVQVYGRCRVYNQNTDVSGLFLQKQLEDLSQAEEGKIKEPGTEWEVSEAPAPYLNLLKKAIVGIEIVIERIEGRFKLSQDKKDTDWVGVVEGFTAQGTPESVKMAEMVKEQGAKRNVEWSA